MFLAIILCVSLACTADKSNKKITIKNLYSIEVPSGMTKTSTINSDASLQYQNLIKDEYIIVIDEPISEFYNALEGSEVSQDLQGYYDIVVANLEMAASELHITDKEDIKINSLPAKLFTATARVENYDVFYKYCVVEGQKNFYQILYWTSSDKKNKRQEAMTATIKTFQEVAKKEKRKINK